MTERKRTVLALAALTALAAGALAAILPPNRGGFLSPFLPGIRLGLDLAGGTLVTYEVDTTGVAQADRASAAEGVRAVIERRVDAFGLAEPRVQVVRGDPPRIIVELPAVQDADAALRQIGETPQLDFRILPKEGPALDSAPAGQPLLWQRTTLSGKHLKRADVAFHPQTGEPQVSLLFDAEGKKLFGELTKSEVGRPIAIFLDGRPITTPVVQESITTGEAVITGSFTVDQARLLATRLTAGALPVPIHLVSRTTVGPVLGRSSLAASVVAGLIGMLLVAASLVSLYRLPGVVAVVALLLYAILVLATLSILGATLTLAGIAGFILSLGMAVDANILVFERLKEELRAGVPVQGATARAFREAWPSIRDSNVSSFITAGLLYAFGSNVVRGFATTLAIGIGASMFTAITATRVLLRAVSLVGVFRAPSLYATFRTRTRGKDTALPARARAWLGLSGMFALAGLLLFFLRPPPPGIDFTGGSLLEVTGPSLTRAALVSALREAGETSATLQETGAESFLLRLRPLSTDEHATLRARLADQFPGITEARFEVVGPTIGRILLRRAIYAVVLALSLILLYLAIVFRRATTLVSPWSFGAIAIIALAHDLAVMGGAFSLYARARAATADSLFLTAALTLLGFSVHDTIVVFNRVKSNLMRLPLSFADLVERAVTETFARSLNTSVTTLFPLLALAFFGSAVTRPFVLALAVGLVVGTYSSIFLASPLLILWHRRTHAPAR